VHRSPASRETIVYDDMDIVRIAGVTIYLSSWPRWKKRREGTRMDGIVEIVDTVEVLPT
jgi:hypothetical protein